MPEGRINFTQCPDTNGKKPHYKGYLIIGDEVHEFAVWPAKTGNGYSGMYKPKGERQAPPVPAAPPQYVPDDSEIPF